MRILFRHKLHNGEINRMDAESGQALEEAIFIPRPGKATEEEGGFCIALHAMSIPRCPRHSNA